MSPTRKIDRPLTPALVGALPVLVLEEALDALLVRVRWYVTRCFADRDIPESTRLSFNYLCDVLGKPNAYPWKRLRR